jgi:hypothetical protein
VGRARRRADADTGEPRSKPCAVCGRRIEWRAKWARDWADVRYCSTACRRRGLGPADAALEGAIRDLLAAHPRSAGVDPHEAVARVAPAAEAGERSWAESARMAARRLVARGEVEIVQDGRVVDPSTARGPIRVRRARPPA